MSFPTIFANLAAGTQPASLLDTMFNICGGMGNIPCTAAGTNAVVLTPVTNFFQPAAYANNQIVSWVQPATTTGAVTVALGGLAAVNLYLPNARQANANDIVTNDHCTAAFFQDLNTGAGGFLLLTTYPRLPNSTQARIGSDQTFTNNTTNATLMSVNCVGGLTYSFMAIVLATMGSAAGGVQLTVNGAGGLTASNINYGTIGGDSTGAVVAGPVLSALGTNFVFTGTGTSVQVNFQGSITVGVGGQLVVQGAQRTSNAAATIYKQGSHLLIWN